MRADGSTRLCAVKSFTLNQKPETPKLSALNYQPSTLHPQPSTLNPKPSTPNPKSGKVRMFGGEMDLMYGPGSEGED